MEHKSAEKAGKDKCGCHRPPAVAHLHEVANHEHSSPVDGCDCRRGTHAPTLLYHCPGCRCCQRSPPRRATLRLRGRGDKACSERSCARYRCPSNAGRMVTERCSRGAAAQGLKLGVRRPCCCSAQSKALPGPARQRRNGHHARPNHRSNLTCAIIRRLR